MPRGRGEEDCFSLSIWAQAAILGQTREAGKQTKAGSAIFKWGSLAYRQAGRISLAAELGPAAIETCSKADKPCSSRSPYKVAGLQI
jgi:hypothetical protein